MLSANARSSRPCERRDPYAAASHFSIVADDFCFNKQRWLWVPAFAGTTRCGARRDAHNSRALLNVNDDIRRVFSSRISVRVIGGSARWLQFSRSQSRQLTPIGVPSVFSRLSPLA